MKIQIVTKTLITIGAYFLIAFGNGYADQPADHQDVFDIIQKGDAPSAVACFYMVLNYYMDQQVFKDTDCRTDVPLDDIIEDEITSGDGVWEWINSSRKSGITLSDIKEAAEDLHTINGTNCEPYYIVQIETDSTDLNDEEDKLERQNRLHDMAANFLERNYPTILHMEPAYWWQSGFYVVLLGYENGQVTYACPRDGGYIKTISEEDFLNAYFYRPGRYYRARWDGTWVGFGKSEFIPGNYRKTLKHDGYNRYYNLHIPSSYDGFTPVPLIINFHGFCINYADLQQEISGYDTISDEQGCIVAYLDGVSFMNTGYCRSWNADMMGAFPWVPAVAAQIDDISFTKTVVNEIKSNYAIDPKRVYLTGISQGGALALLLAHEQGEQASNEQIFAAVAVKSTRLLLPLDQYYQELPIPIAMFHAYGDPSYDDSYMWSFVFNNAGIPIIQHILIPGAEESLARLAEVGGWDENDDFQVVNIVNDDGVQLGNEKITTYAIYDDEGALTIAWKLYSLEGEHNLRGDAIEYHDNMYIPQEVWKFLSQFSLP